MLSASFPLPRWTDWSYRYGSPLPGNESPPKMPVSKHQLKETRATNEFSGLDDIHKVTGHIMIENKPFELCWSHLWLIFFVLYLGHHQYSSLVSQTLNPRVWYSHPDHCLLPLCVRMCVCMCACVHTFMKKVFVSLHSQLVIFTNSSLTTPSWIGCYRHHAQLVTLKCPLVL